MARSFLSVAIAVWVVALSTVACVTAHPAEFASKQWGCPEARITVTSTPSRGSGRAYMARGCGKQMIVECVYRDESPDTPYECTSRDEQAIAAPRATRSAPAPRPSASAAPLPPSPPPAVPVVDASSVAHFVATDGRTFPMSDHDAKIETLTTSGAFDLGCAPASVTARILQTADLGKPLYVAEGCGQRASYAFVRRDDASPEVDVAFLTSVVPVKSPPSAPY